MKTILLLGGSAQQIPAIETAKRLGYRTVLCDYLPDNPGRHYADVFYPVSTTDREAILSAARRERADGIVAYASDPAAPTAAWAAQQLGLPGNPYDAVDILCSKDKFRAFLHRNGFCAPAARGYDSIAAAEQDLRDGAFQFPVMVKPVDSSGSKGVGKIDRPDGCTAALERAMEQSRAGRIIIEEYIGKSGFRVAGDGLSVDGRLVFCCFGDDWFEGDNPNPFVPVAASFPCTQPARIQDKIRDTIQRLITLLGMRTCAYNFDIRVDENENIYLLEVAPRSGGNYIPQIVRYMSGVDLAECSVRAAMGENVAVSPIPSTGCYAYYAVHSRHSGTLERVVLRGNMAPHVLENHILARPGDEIHAFTRSNAALGCLVLRFDDLRQQTEMLLHPEMWLEVRLR